MSEFEKLGCSSVDRGHDEKIHLRWLTIRLEGMASLIKLAVAILVVIYREELSEAAVGLALTYAIDVTYNTGRLVRSYCDIETSMVAVERAQKLCCLPTVSHTCTRRPVGAQALYKPIGRTCF